MPLSATQPYEKAVARGAPIIIDPSFAALQEIKVAAAISSLKGQNDLIIAVYDNDKKVDEKNIKIKPLK